MPAKPAPRLPNAGPLLPDWQVRTQARTTYYQCRDPQGRAWEMWHARADDTMPRGWRLAPADDHSCAVLLFQEGVGWLDIAASRAALHLTAAPAVTPDFDSIDRALGSTAFALHRIAEVMTADNPTEVRAADEISEHARTVERYSDILAVIAAKLHSALGLPTLTPQHPWPYTIADLRTGKPQCRAHRDRVEKMLPECTPAGGDQIVIALARLHRSLIDPLNYPRLSDSGHFYIDGATAVFAHIVETLPGPLRRGTEAVAAYAEKVYGITLAPHQRDPGSVHLKDFIDQTYQPWTIPARHP